MFMLPLFALLRHLAEPTPFLPLSSLPQKSLHSGRFPLPSLPLELKSYFIPRGKEILGWVISSDLLSLNDSDKPNFPHRSSGSCSSPDIYFAPFSCSLKALQDLGSDHLPILLTFPLFPVFRPNKLPPFFNF